MINSNVEFDARKRTKKQRPSISDKLAQANRISQVEAILILISVGYGVGYIDVLS